MSPQDRENKMSFALNYVLIGLNIINVKMHMISLVATCFLVYEDARWIKLINKYTYYDRLNPIPTNHETILYHVRGALIVHLEPMETP